jgi:Ni/Co efflux regulator RcnB
MDMRKLLSYILVLAFALPLVAQESESKDEAKDEKVVRQHNKKDWDRGDMRKRMGMQRANQERKKMHKKRAIRSAVRIIVVGGLAYYIGYHQGEKHFKGGWNRKPPMGDRK